MDRGTLADFTVLAVLALAAALLSVLLVPLVRRVAVAWGAIDVPDARRVLVKPTPRLGGVAIFVAFVVVMGAGASVGRVSLTTSPPDVAAFLIAAFLVLGIGAVDDFRRQRPAVKLAVEIVAALIVVYLGHCRVVGISMPGGNALSLGTLAAPLTVVWIVFVTNAVNLIDGIDGLAAGTSAIALVTVAVIARGFGFPTVAACAATLVGACAGFLVFNLHPASIFLGDAGSLFLGFSIAVLATYARAKESTGAITIGTLLIVALPVGDTLFAIRRRYFAGLSVASPRSHLAGLSRVLRPDNNHIHHRLLRVGLGQRAAAWALYGIQAAACGYAIYLLVKR